MSLTLPKHLKLKAEQIIKAYEEKSFKQEALQIRRITESPFNSEEEAFDFFEAVYEELGEMGVFLPKYTVHIQRQLENRLTVVAKRPKLCADAKKLIAFLQEASDRPWSQDDSQILIKDFKLVQDEGEYERICSSKRASKLSDLFGIKACFIETPYIEQCRKKRLLRQNRQLLKPGVQDRSKRLQVFNWWNNLVPSATFYIFVP